MDITTDRARLHDRLKDLRARWLQIQTEWNDPVRREFEKTHWTALEERVRIALRAMDQLAPILTQVRHDCS